MTTSDVVSELGNKWWPLPPEKFFRMPGEAPNGMPDLPPTVQAEMASPFVTQAKAMFQYQVIQSLMTGERRRMAQNQARRFTEARSRVGKRVKSSRH